MVYNLSRLRYQFDWSGAKLINRRVKVCPTCLDRPQEQLRTIRMTPDPLPVRDPRPLNNAAVMGGYADIEVVNGTRQLVTHASGADAYAGYPGSPFSTEAEELSDLPLAIDPPT